MAPTKKVIMPEDVKAVLEKERSFLDRSDIETVTAVTNEEALALHRGEKANLIVAHLEAPGMNGETLCSVIRDSDELRNVSIILVCQKNAADDGRCIQCGANSFVTVPIHDAVLLQEAYQLLHVAPRRSCRISIRVGIDGMSKGKPFAGLAENMSVSGMLFRSAAIFNEGDSVRCSFSLPGSAQISARAEIMRVVEKEGETDTHLYGVRFSDPEDNAVSILEAFVEKSCGRNRLI